jgi:O-antigen ligase
MTARAAAALTRPGVPAWLGLAVAAGAIVGGAAATAGPKAAVAVAVLGLAGTLLLLRPLSILVLMGATAYIEGVQLGGTTISRFVAAGALFVALADATRTGRWTMPSGPPLVWAVAYGIWAFASVLWTVNLEETWLSLAPLIVSLTFMAAIPALVRSRRTFDLVLYGIGGGAAVVGMLAVAVFVTTGGRAEGLVGDPNFFAAYQVIAFPILLVLGARTKSLWLRLLLWGGVVAAVGAIFSTLSRGGILALAVVGILLLVLPARSIFRSFGHKSMATLVIAIGVGLALTVSYAEISERIVSLVQGGEATGSGRVNEWRAAWRLSQENPTLGVGYAAFAIISNDAVRRTPGTDLRNFDERPPGVFVHNAYLGSLTELGVLGLVLFVGVLFSTARALRRAAVRARWLGDVDLARTANALLLSLVGWAVASFFLSSETARPQWIIVGLALALPAVLRETAAGRRRAS